jgi:hypothetical protein
MWKGPTAEVKAAWADPLWGDLASYLKRHGGVNCTVANDGRSVVFYEIKEIKGELYRYDLDTVAALGPYQAILQGCRRFCPITAELIALHWLYYDRLAGEIEIELTGMMRRLDGTLEEIKEVMSHVRT